ncbi:MAG: GNAT family N-acetyltransferase [Oscillospiraceae bacterium]|nr:GNAT family N-acetyltransferase [Oscillospiraceae bacterium]
MNIRAYTDADLQAMIAIWNEVVEAGNAFPQEEPLDLRSGAAFFAQQTYTGVAEREGKICGLYILHPNNVGRCGHICNASYAVSGNCRGEHIGAQLVLDCLAQAKAHGFRVLQFNAVVESNIHARHLYERLGFTQLGTIKGGFRMPDGEYVNICPYYREV